MANAISATMISIRRSDIRSIQSTLDRWLTDRQTAHRLPFPTVADELISSYPNGLSSVPAAPFLSGVFFSSASGFSAGLAALGLGGGFAGFSAGFAGGALGVVAGFVSTFTGAGLGL